MWISQALDICVIRHLNPLVYLDIDVLSFLPESESPYTHLLSERSKNVYPHGFDSIIRLDHSHFPLFC